MATREVKALERKPLTDHVIAQIESLDIIVGDAEAPEEGGWSGPPDSADSDYTPYVVVVPGTTGEATGPIGSTASDIQTNYVVSGYGLTRGHVEDYLDYVRRVLVAMARTIVVLGESTWRIQQVRCNSIGGITRNDSIEPSEFSQTDVFVLYMSREL